MDVRGIHELKEILTRWGWCMATEVTDPKAIVEGIIIGTEKYVTETIHRLKPVDREVVVEEVTGAPV